MRQLESGGESEISSAQIGQLVMDALKGYGVRNIDMPLFPDRVYTAIQTGKDVSGAPPVKVD